MRLLLVYCNCQLKLTNESLFSEIFQLDGAMWLFNNNYLQLYISFIIKYCHGRQNFIEQWFGLIFQRISMHDFILTNSFLFTTTI